VRRRLLLLLLAQIAEACRDTWGYIKGLDRGYIKGLDRGYIKGLDRGYIVGLDRGCIKGLDRGYMVRHEAGARPTVRWKTS
jgi:hypothetical protein